ncbi:MAG: hypothetical protein MUF45_07670 [Spirosomaceae bacterium]|jgi:hypothetical protein|nr:hypothetical protein [Spirosomataceae bacterium]
MNLKAEILKEHSKVQTQRIADYIGADKNRFAELIELFLNGEYRITQRAAWVVSEVVSKYPFLVEPHLAGILKKLREPGIHDAVKRNVVRIFEDIEILDEYLEDITDLCFNFLTNPAEAIAIKAFSMTVLSRIVKKIPELKNELIFTIEDLMIKHQDQSPAIISRGKKVIKQLKK